MLDAAVGVAPAMVRMVVPVVALVPMDKVAAQQLQKMAVPVAAALVAVAVSVSGKSHVANQGKQAVVAVVAADSQRMMVVADVMTTKSAAHAKSAAIQATQPLQPSIFPSTG